MEDRKLWAVHTDNETRFLERNMIAVDGCEIGDLSSLPTDRHAFRRRYDAAYPGQSPVLQATGAAVLYRLVHELRSGDYIVFPHGPWIELGIIIGEYGYDEQNAHHRAMEWRQRLPRSAFSRDALRVISSSPAPLFAVRHFAGEFFAALGVPYLEKNVIRKPRLVQVSSSARKPESDTLSASVEAFRHSPEDVQEFLSSFLRAMGYRVDISGYADRIEIAAAQDMLLPRVRIRVERPYTGVL